MMKYQSDKNKNTKLAPKLRLTSDLKAFLLLVSLDNLRYRVIGGGGAHCIQWV